MLCYTYITLSRIEAALDPEIGQPYQDSTQPAKGVRYRMRHNFAAPILGNGYDYLFFTVTIQPEYGHAECDCYYHTQTKGLCPHIAQVLYFKRQGDLLKMHQPEEPKEPQPESKPFVTSDLPLPEVVVTDLLPTGVIVAINYKDANGYAMPGSTDRTVARKTDLKSFAEFQAEKIMLKHEGEQVQREVKALNKFLDTLDRRFDLFK